MWIHRVEPLRQSKKKVPYRGVRKSAGMEVKSKLRSRWDQRERRSRRLEEQEGRRGEVHCGRVWRRCYRDVPQEGQEADNPSSEDENLNIDMARQENIELLLEMEKKKRMEVEIMLMIYKKREMMRESEDIKMKKDVATQTEAKNDGEQAENELGDSIDEIQELLQSTWKIIKSM